MLKYIAGLIALSALTGCSTMADPEPYMSFDCEQLRTLSDHSLRPMEALATNRVGPDPQAGLMGDREGLQTESDVAAEKQDDETRAIRAAYRAKKCR